MSVVFLSILLIIYPLIAASPLNCPTITTSGSFGSVFLTNGGGSLARGPLPMVLPEDSGYALDTHRHRRHVVCGRTDKKAEVKTFEDRAVCQYHYVLNKNERRVPDIMEEIECDCIRPSHLSPYTEIRCEPIKYRIPVLMQDETGHYHPSHEEITLACIPVAPKPNEEFEIVNLP